MKSFDNCLLHAISAGDVFESEVVLSKLENILECGYLLSKRKQGNYNFENSGYNGLDYISLCDYAMKDAKPYGNMQIYKGYNSYNTYIKLSLSLVFNKKPLKYVRPLLIPHAVFDQDPLMQMKILGDDPERRFTDMPDEVQIKDMVSLKNLVGITLPISYMTDNHKEVFYKNSKILKMLKRINYLLRKYNYNNPIYDLDTLIELKDMHSIEYILKNKY